MLRNKSSANVLSGATAEQAELIDREKNAVRYMAGYVAVTLLKRYKKHSKDDKVRLKTKLFVSILKSMAAEHQPENVESVEEYSTLEQTDWSWWTLSHKWSGVLWMWCMHVHLSSHFRDRLFHTCKFTTLCWMWTVEEAMVTPQQSKYHEMQWHWFSNRAFIKTSRPWT